MAVAKSRSIRLGVGHFDLRPLCVKGDLKNIIEYWNRFNDQIEWTQGSEGTTPLHEATNKGHGEVVQFLLSKGAKIDAVSSKGKTALFIAGEACNSDCEVLLVNKKASLFYTHNSVAVSCFDTADGQFLKFITGHDIGKYHCLLAMYI